MDLTTGWVRTTTLVAALGSGLAAGVFFAFSSFVMTALRRLPPRDGLAAMQSINRAAPTFWFMAVLMGTAALALVLTVAGVRALGDPRGVLVVVGGVLYLAAILLTGAYHVPRNDALARVALTSPGAARAWLDYAGPWTALNHVRTLLCLAASTSFVLALRR